ncbi:MAG: hypothetical protein ACRYG5_08060 [Janthinobacterium lividum]
MNPGKNSAPHNHTTWVVVAAVKGEEINRIYQRVDDGSDPEHAELKVAREVVVRPGSGVHFLPNDFHSIHTGGSETAWQLHLYGRALETLTERLGFDEVTGELVRHNSHRYAQPSGGQPSVSR